MARSTGTLMEKSVHHRFTTENLWKLMVSTSIPGMVGMVIVSLDSFIDALFVGRFLGANALAGVSLVLPLTIITTGFTGLLASGFGSLLSRAIGANNISIYPKLFSNLLAMVCIVAGLLSLIGYIFADKLVRLIGASEVLFDAGYEYYSTYILGAVFTMAGVAFGGLIRSQGDLKMATIYSSLAVLTNILFNYIFIVIFKYGVKGAALSSVLSMVLLSVCNGLHFMKKNNIPLKAMVPKLEKKVLREVLVVGQATLVMQLLNFVRQVLIVKSAAKLGSAVDIAVLGAIFRVFMVSVIPVFGMLQAMQPIVGVNFGAGRLERISQTLVVFRAGGFLVLLMLCLPSVIFSEYVLSLFLTETVFEPYHLFHFRMVMCILPFTIFSSTGITFLQAIGAGKVTSVLLFFRQILVFLPVIFILIYLRGYTGIYEAVFIENICFALIVTVFTRRYFKELMAKEKLQKNKGIITKVPKNCTA